MESEQHAGRGLAAPRYLVRGRNPSCPEASAWDPSQRDQTLRGTNIPTIVIILYKNIIWPNILLSKELCCSLCITECVVALGFFGLYIFIQLLLCLVSVLFVITVENQKIEEKCSYNPNLFTLKCYCLGSLSLFVLVTTLHTVKYPK